MPLRRLAALVAVAVACSGPATAQAKPRAHAASFTVQIIRRSCPVAGEVVMPGACAYPDRAVVYAPPWVDAFAVNHEVCHVEDYWLLTPYGRSLLTTALGFTSGTPWRVGYTLGASLRSPAERFADACAAYRLGMDPNRTWETAYGWSPSHAQFDRVIVLFGRLGIG